MTFKEIMEDPNLSLQAKGLYVFMNSAEYDNSIPLEIQIKNEQDEIQEALEELRSYNILRMEVV